MELTAAARAALPPSAFAGPGRTYPVQDRAHAIAAESYAKQALEAGRMSAPEYRHIMAAALRELGRRMSGG